MKKRVYALLFIAVLSVSLLVGCSQSSNNTSGHIDLVPETANMIAYVNLSQITGDGDIAEIYAALPKEAVDPQTIEEALSEAMDIGGLDLRDFEEAWIFGDISQTNGDKDYYGAILRGSFEEPGLLANIESAGGKELASTGYQGYTIHTWSGQEAGLAVLSSDLLVTGSTTAIADVIAVREGNLPSVGEDLLAAYDDLGDAILKLAIAVPPGLLEQKLEEITNGTSAPPALNALADVQIAGISMAKNGQSLAFSSQFCFSNSQSANDVKGLMPFMPVVIGAIEMPEGSAIQKPEKALALLPELINKDNYDCHVTGSRLTISSDLTAADIEAMSAEPAPSGLAIAMAVNMGSLTTSGLDVSIDATISNHIALKFDVGDLRLAATSKSGQTYIEEYIAGSVVPASSSATFKHNIVVPLELVSERELVITIDTTAEARGLSLPLSSSVLLTTPGIESLITVPEINLAVDFGEFTSDGLHMGLQANLSNSNPFGIDVGDLQIVATGQSGNVILTSTMPGSSIGPHSVGTLSADLLMPIEVVSEPAIVITVQSRAGFAGVSLPVSARLTVNMPDLESISVPEIDVGVDIGEITSDGLHMGLQATITNSNPFGIDVGDLQVVATGQSGNVILAATTPGCSIGPNSIGTLSADLLIPLEAISEPTIVITVQTQAGLAGINLPINAKVTVNMLDLESITVPEIDLGVDFGELTSDGLHMGLQATITNPNLFGIDVGDLLIVTTGHSGNVILTTTMPGCSIGPDSVGTLSADLLMPLEVLNESTIAITVQTQAGLVGISLPVNAKVTVKMPDIESLITVPKIEMYAEPSLVSGFPLPGLHVVVASTIPNSNSVDLIVDDIQVTFFDSDGKLVEGMTIPGGTIKAHSSRTFSGSVTLSASEYLGLISGDYFRVEIATGAGIGGVDATIPIEAAMTMVLSSLVEVPQLDLGLAFGELTSDGLHMGLQTNLSNSNPFSIDIGDVQIAVKGQSGNTILTGIMPGCSIGPDSIGTLSADLLMPLEVLNESSIIITVRTEGGFAGVTQPINAKVTISMPDIAGLITTPAIDMGVGFGELASDGLHLELQANVTNSNSFGIEVGDLQIVIKGQSGNTILAANMNGCSIGPDSTGTVSADLLMPLEVVNETAIVIAIQTQGGLGEITLPIDAEVTVKMPDMESLVSVPEIDLAVVLGEPTSEALPMTLQATITNPNAFDIDVGDLQIVVKDQSGKVLFTGNMSGCSIQPDSTGTLSVDLLLPLEVLNESTVVITIQTQAEFAGITLPVNANLLLINMPDAEGGAEG